MSLSEKEDTTSIGKVEKLNGTPTIHPWTSRMEKVLGYHDLDDHIDVEACATAATLSGDEREAWKKADKKALTRISLAVTDDVLTHIEDAMTALEAWTTLQNTYRTGGILGMVGLRRSLYGTLCAEGSDISEHIRTLKMTKRELAYIGFPVLDGDFSAVLLASLPGSWQSFIQTLDVNALFVAPPKTETLYAPKPAMSSDQLISRVMTEDRRQTARTDAETALAGKEKPGKAKWSGAAGNGAVKGTSILCYRCGKRGHIARNCLAPEPMKAGDTAPAGSKPGAAAKDTAAIVTDIACAAFSDVAAATVSDTE